MIGNLFIDLVVCVWLGSLFALSAQKAIGESRKRLSRPLIRALLYGLVIMVPMACYLARVYPSWSGMYHLEPPPFLLSSLMVFSLPLVLVGSYLLAERSIRAGTPVPAFFQLALGLLGEVSLLVLGWERISQLGTLESFVGGFGVDLMDNPRFLAELSIVNGAAFLGLVVVIVANLKLEARKQAGGG